MAAERGTSAGRTLAGYRVVALAGRGGTGEVYRARDERLDRDVALKVPASRYAADPVFRARLLRESRLAASLDHPNVVPVYDAGESDGLVFIAMRCVDGCDLAGELRPGRSRGSGRSRWQPRWPPPWTRPMSRASCTAT
jgi:serine/threonine-protein kinase